MKGTPWGSSATSIKKLVGFLADEECIYEKARAAFRSDSGVGQIAADCVLYLEPHGVPSGGDWGLERRGALFFEGTEELVVDGCRFERLDGNGIMLSGYNTFLP
eukprot:gene18096-biopygen16006